MKKTVKKLLFKLIKLYRNRVKNFIDGSNEKLRLEEDLQYVRAKGGNIKIGNGFFKTLPEMINIGSGVILKNNVSIHAAHGVILSDHVTLGNNVTLNSFFNVKLKNQKTYPIYIGENSVISDNVVIYPDVSIGENVFVAPGEKVNENIPSNCSLIEGQLIRGSGVYAITKKSRLKSAFDMGENLFFIVSTGRAGSQAIAEILSQHPSIECKHEHKWQLIKLSTEYEHHIKNKEEVKKELKKIYSSSMIRKEIYGESDQKISNLIPIYKELFPKAKFIWLYRDPEPSIISAYGKGWFDDREYGYLFREEYCVSKLHSPFIFQQNRLNGYLVGEFTEIEWKKMTPFERNCWYWTYWNTRIQNNLEDLPSEDKYRLNLKDFNTEIFKIVDFLNCEKFNFIIKKHNEARYKKPSLNVRQQEILKDYMEKIII